MAKSILKVKVVSRNALACIDLVYIDDGKQIRFPRIRQLDDRLAPVFFLKDKDAQDNTYKSMLFASIDGHISASLRSFQDLHAEVDQILAEDQLKDAIDFNQLKPQVISVEAKTPACGAMLRVILNYDELFKKLHLMRRAGIFLGSNPDLDRSLLAKAGKIARVMLNDINAEIIVIKKLIDEPASEFGASSNA